MSEAKKHIVLLVSRLDQPGGTERANLNAATLFAEKGHAVTLVILDETAQTFYPIDNCINTVHRAFAFGIGKKGNVLTRKFSLLKEIYLLGRLLRKLRPDLIIATDYVFAVAAVLAGCHKWTNVFSWEHHHFHWLEKNRFWRWLMKKTYPKLKAILVYNSDEIQYYPKRTVLVVPNFIPHMPEPTGVVRQKAILTVGWLIRRKGVDLIPAIAEKFLKRHPDWKWTIIGEGELKKELLVQIQATGLARQIELQTPEKPLTAEDYQAVSLFVMTSRMEPFGLVLIEAMCNGVPCVAFDCESGPRHIIRHNESGFLVPPENTAAMAAAIEKLVADEPLRNRMANGALKDASRFSADSVYECWKKVIYSA